MGLIDELGYRGPSPNLLQRLVNTLAGTRLSALVMSRALHWLDRAARWATGGKSTLSSWSSGQQIIWLEVTGRRSGRTRSVPLIPIPVGSDLAVIGSNFGRADDPAWVLNLTANPDVEVALGERAVLARARRADPDECEAAWLIAGNLFPGYPRYRRQVTGRRIKVFVLESVSRLPSTG